MAHRDYVPITINIDAKGFDKIAQKLETSLSTIDAITHALQDSGRIWQRRAVSNVSGTVRTFDGKSFIVNRVTGKLARSIQLSYPNPLAVMLDASAEYASDVEQGTRGPTDLKKTRLSGKIVPLPVNTARGKQLTIMGKNGVRIADPGIKSMFVGRFDNKETPTSGLRGYQQKATTGKVMGTRYILFRRVPGRGGKGWVVPARPPAAFMAESAKYVTPILQEAVEKAYADFLNESTR